MDVRDLAVYFALQDVMLAVCESVRVYRDVCMCPQYPCVGMATFESIYIQQVNCKIKYSTFLYQKEALLWVEVTRKFKE